MLKKIDGHSIEPWGRWLSSAFQPPPQAEYDRADEVGHFYGVDLLRGLAAVATLVWHYQHFYMAAALKHGQPTPGVVRTTEPFYWLLQPIYEHGFWAVQAFWIISGFVFAHVYAGRNTRPGEFLLARFARLYPLHLITLVTIATSEAISRALLNGFQIVSMNDPFHFYLHVLFVSGWGFQLGNSFNEPVWSVSVELAIYALFYLVARRVFTFGPVIPLFLAGLGWAVTNQGTPVWLFGMCLFFFFEGTLVYYTLIRFHERSGWLLALCAASLGIFTYNVMSGKATTIPFPDLESNLFLPIVLMVAMVDYSKIAHSFIKPIRWLGDATYSMYLWHVPLQVILLILVESLRIDDRHFNNPFVFCGWIMGMIGFAHVSFRFIEKPAQLMVRRIARRLQVMPARL